MHIVIPAERLAGERRVAATPDTVKKLVGAGHVVTVERGAGLHAAIADAAYADVGAGLSEQRQTLLAQADVALVVHMPEAADLEALKPGAALVGMLAPYGNPLLPRLAARRISAFALELLPRTTRAQSMDVLSSQNNIAGYKAVLLATQFYPRFMPMLMTAAGTVKPARVLVLGVGVAGLQAIATAKRLGAVVEAYDVRPATREQVESLGAKFVEVPMTDEEKAAGGGVYAREMSADFQQRQNELLAKHARNADIVIATALIPGKPAPRLVTASTVAEMKPGSVIIDLAAESGGNCELTRLGEAYQSDRGVHLVGYANLASLLAADASSLYARNLHAFLGLLLAPEGLKIDLADELIAATLLTHQGEQRFGAAPSATAAQEPHHG
ncbi:Re/Si-specific NAD(P)(+) transhydrogenase subunit alpha [Chromobacterium sphagni]|uniref:proton-translocating NAD(P)(+) transhydrogenase n=1 Tax=Chromobacterium sphagni TaxID=1903179 RepID=A0ABX3CHN3_9NEIS|nr:Re/Si-specific NAD(P)(+) transhydrogenase subunit alpha [Chromobacterium sphagni]OHX21858.1 NADP transhydrogenase subunit alpha [Chromobacterium sphagni]